MKKWLRRILLCIILAFVVWAGVLYNCANENRKYNVVIECAKQTVFGLRYYTGSGVVISKDGLILTAKHVVENSESLRITLSDGRVFDVNDYYVDVEDDVGIIDLFTDVNDYVMLADSNDIKKGNIIYNIGNPKGIWANSILFGIVHKNHFKMMFLGENSEYIFIRANIQSGCSGGGVYHYKKLIGLVVSKYAGGSFVVPSNVCKQVVEDYRNASEK